MSEPREYVIIGVDPGKMTGMFMYAPQGRLGGFRPSGLKPFYAWQEFEAHTAPHVLRNEIVDLAGRYGHSSVHIAVERFIINTRTAKSSAQGDALEITGMVRAFAKLYTSNEIRQYMKANLKFANDEALKRVGWYSSQMGHANDAARQAFALLKDMDYPHWSALVSDAMVESEDEGRKTP